MQYPQREVTQNSAGPRMEKEIGKDSDGKARKEKQEEKENVHLRKDFEEEVREGGS